MGRKVKTDFLVGSGSFLIGTARLLDFYGQFDEYNVSPSEAEADAMAMFSDWLIVGQDIQDALEQVDEPKACTA